MNTPSTRPPEPSGVRRPFLNGPSRKIFHIAFLVAATLAASWMVSGVIDEREERQNDIRREFANSWGPAQVVDTPILVVPHTMKTENIIQRRYVKIAPSTLRMTVNLSPEKRNRGLFSATVFGATIDMQGKFSIPEAEKLQELAGTDWTPHWDQSFVMLATSDLSGMAPGNTFTWNGQTFRWQNCREVNQGSDCGHSSVLALRPLSEDRSLAGTEVPFAATATLRGTGSFSQRFRAKEMDMTMTAPWGTPSFIGNRLPQSHAIEDADFTAHWQTAEYSAPQVWLSSQVFEKIASDTATAGVTLLEATPIYRMIHRASKYDTLFVILAFTTYFLFELLTGIRIHMVQYGMLGASLTLFGLLLVSFSEPLGYTLGYLSGAGLVLLQASLYTAAISKRPRLALIFATILAGLFGFLYVVLSLETYALLAGSVALFGVLSLVMALTQRIDWSTGQRVSAGKA